MFFQIFLLELISVNLYQKSQIVAGGQSDSKVRIFDMNSEAHLESLRNHKETINQIEISRNGKQIVTASSDKSVFIQSAEKRKILHELIGHNEDVMVAKFSKCGLQVATGSQDRSFKIWDVESGLLMYSFKLNILNMIEYSSSVEFTDDSRYIIVASENFNAKKINLMNQSTEIVQTGHTNQITSIAVSGQYLVTAGSDGQTFLWDIDSGHKILKQRKLNSFTKSIDISINQILIAVTEEGEIQAFNLLEENQHSVVNQLEPAFTAKFRDCGNMVLVGQKNNSMKLLDLQSGTIIKVQESESPAKLNSIDVHQLNEIIG